MPSSKCKIILRFISFMYVVSTPCRSFPFKDASSLQRFRSLAWASIPADRHSPDKHTVFDRAAFTHSISVVTLRKPAFKNAQVREENVTLANSLGSRSPPKPRDWSKLGTYGHDYERFPGDSGSLDHVPGGRDTVEKLLASRLRLKLKQEYDAHVAIRKELSSFGVYIHDGLRMWRGDGVTWGMALGPKGHDYVRWAEDNEDVSLIDGGEQTVDVLLAERVQAKIDHDYHAADRILSELSALGVAVHDKLKMWKIDNGENDIVEGDGLYVYSLPFGRLEDVDSVKVLTLINERYHQKMNGNIRASNRIKKELVKIGIQVSGRSRKFNPENHPYSPLSGRLFQALSDDDLAAVDTLLHNRHEALRARNYRKADELQGDLLRKGIEVDDFNCCWRFKEDNTFAPANWQVDF